jgi:hypothetical protein
MEGSIPKSAVRWPAKDQHMYAPDRPGACQDESLLLHCKVGSITCANFDAKLRHVHMASHKHDHNTGGELDNAPTKATHKTAHQQQLCKHVHATMQGGKLDRN